MQTTDMQASMREKMLMCNAICAIPGSIPLSNVICILLTCRFILVAVGFELFYTAHDINLKGCGPHQGSPLRHLHQLHRGGGRGGGGAGGGSGGQGHGD